MRTQPQVADLAREVRYRLFEALAMEEARLAAYEVIDEHLAALVRNDLDEDERAEHLRVLGTFPTPLAPRLLGRLAGDPEELGTLLLELLTRRYYRHAPSQPTSTSASTAGSCTPAARGRAPVHVVAGWSPLAALADLVADLGPLLAELPAGEKVRVDLCVWSDAPIDDDELAIEAARTLAPLAACRTSSTPRSRPSSAATPPTARPVHHVTFRVGEDGQLARTARCAGLQPMMAERLQLWRYDNFDLHRLPSEDGIHLFRAVAWSNPKDERLFAIAEVRTLTPDHAEDGSVRRFVEVDWALTRAFDAMRGALAAMPLAARPVWNRITLHVWPVVELSLEELGQMSDELAPVAVGLGLEEVDVSCRRRDPVTGKPVAASAAAVPFGRRRVHGHRDAPARRPAGGARRVRPEGGALPPPGTPYPYELLELLTARNVGGSRPSPAGRSRSTTWSTAGSNRSTARRGRTRPASSSGW
jgi:hypothetical protein